MNFLLKLNPHFFLKNSGGEIGDPTAEIVVTDPTVDSSPREQQRSPRGESAGYYPDKRKTVRRD